MLRDGVAGCRVSLQIEYLQRRSSAVWIARRFVDRCGDESN